MDSITTTSELSLVCERLASQAFVTVDTEFMRESTYYPKLCLIQMAGEEEAVLVDPLAEGLDLAPFFALMADARVTKVFHSARQDIEIIWLLGRMIPKPLFDTQIAAMVCGYGDQVSYEQLANDFAKARVDKSSRFTDWAQRPLSEAQLTYALSDVTHLRVIYERLHAELTEKNRIEWLVEEMLVLESPTTYEVKPEEAWRRISGRLRKTREIAVLMEVAAWREREAQTRNVPRSRILKDDAMVDIAMSAPRTVEALGRLRSISKGMERSKIGSEILLAVEEGFARDLATVPAPSKDSGRFNTGATLDLLKVLLKAVAEAERVAPKILATTDDLQAIALSNEADVPALKGWRREMFGEKALALKAGKMCLLLRDGAVVVDVLAPAEERAS